MVSNNTPSAVKHHVPDNQFTLVHKKWAARPRHHAQQKPTSCDDLALIVAATKFQECALPSNALWKPLFPNTSQQIGSDKRIPKLTAFHCAHALLNAKLIYKPSRNYTLNNSLGLKVTLM